MYNYHNLMHLFLTACKFCSFSWPPQYQTCSYAFVVGNESFGILPADKIDLNYGPEFYLAKKNTTFFSIRITIIPDRRLESNELIRIAIIEPAMPDDVDPPEAEVIIVDDDGKLYQYNNYVVY